MSSALDTPAEKESAEVQRQFSIFSSETLNDDNAATIDQLKISVVALARTVMNSTIIRTKVLNITYDLIRKITVALVQYCGDKRNIQLRTALDALMEEAQKLGHTVVDAAERSGFQAGK